MLGLPRCSKLLSEETHEKLMVSGNEMDPFTHTKASSLFRHEASSRRMLTNRLLCKGLSTREVTEASHLPQ